MSSDTSDRDADTAKLNKGREKFVCKQLAQINGEINRLDREKLVQKLSSLQLDTRGSGDIVKKRLKNYYRETQLQKFQDNTKFCYDYFVVIDFEATCEAKNHFNYRHEIIEFPAVLISTEDREVKDEFHEYCRPVLHPRLSKFCKELTGITQEQVNEADTFPIVLQKFEAWLEKHQLGTMYMFRVITDGSFDMGHFLLLQCRISGLKFPAFGRRWINLKKSYSNFYGSRRYKLQAMLEHLGLKFEGRQHCGLDDSRNIARIVLQMLADGAKLRENEKLHTGGGHSQKSRLKSVVQVSRKEASVQFWKERRKMAARLADECKSEDRDSDEVNNSASAGAGTEVECVTEDRDGCSEDDNRDGCSEDGNRDGCSEDGNRDGCSEDDQSVYNSCSD